ncbi:phosphonate metabolism transcriptional regulator PhnF [Rhizobium sp. L1K21]|uniref:phosphonate metabolism transcriptional regulator PhnF n=1 Tax=Rhizobium sp. L1K21 TaxID=2954933 RepID=UPI002092D3A6|nr:phosphonate metabolism transcriptional regulator PhnF [Rhizobium sp. L1K21]MCO6184646.1 phosphonate metabolism transcriptional regulator PhnF [Rhizobium sp. L1K21]
MSALPKAGRVIDRKSGVAVWRQIADELRAAINGGEFGGEGKLPGEMALAERFGVNRHTVRAAIAALASEGVVEASPGRGTRIIRNMRLKVPISRRTRFSSGLSDQATRLEMSFVSSTLAPAATDVCEALNLENGSTCLVLETVSLVDGIPVSVGRHHFPTPRFGEIDLHFRRERSITKAFRACGVEDYVRASTEITARHADEDERRWLKLAPGAIVLETLAVNNDLQGNAIQFSKTRFASDRVSLRVGFEG